MADKILKSITFPGLPDRYVIPQAAEDLGGGVGKEYTVNGVVKGEIFNDYENNIASGNYSHAEGQNTNAWGQASHAEGTAEAPIPSSVTPDLTNEQIISSWSNAAWDDEAFALAKGVASHIEGKSNLALGNYSHAEGMYTRATGISSHAEGANTQANGDYSHTEGWYTTASGSSSHAEGSRTIAAGHYSHAEGENSAAAGRYSHAEGGYSLASADYDHAEGCRTVAAGSAAHAEGSHVCALGNYSHAEGRGSFTQSISITGSANATLYSVNNTNNILVGAFIETTDHKNWATITSVDTVNKTIQVDKTLSADKALSNSMVNIYLSGLAMGECTHLEGFHTIATDDYQHVQGKYTMTGPYAHIVGNGTAIDARSNAHTIDWDGNAWYAGAVRVGGTAYDDAKELATKEYVNSVSGGLKGNGIFYIEGTQGTYSEDWLGTHENITEYYAGLVVAYKTPTNGGTVGDTVRLNINDLGWTDIVINKNTYIITDYPAGTILLLVYTIDDGTGYWKIYDNNTDTKNTAGSSNKTGSKMYLVGATSQSNFGATTYSNNKVYIGTDNCLYSNGSKVATNAFSSVWTANGSVSATSSSATLDFEGQNGIAVAALNSSGDLIVRISMDTDWLSSKIDEKIAAITNAEEVGF